MSMRAAALRYASSGFRSLLSQAHGSDQAGESVQKSLRCSESGRALVHHNDLPIYPSRGGGNPGGIRSDERQQDRECGQEGDVESRGEAGIGRRIQYRYTGRR